MIRARKWLITRFWPRQPACASSSPTRTPPWQRGANEHTNSLIRQYLPKGTNLSALTQDDLNKIATLLNNQPRKALGFETPNEKLRTLIANDTSISDIIIQGVRYGT